MSRIAGLPHRGVHNFCQGTLDCYFRASLTIDKGDGQWNQDENRLELLKLPGRNANKIFVYGPSNRKELHELQKVGTIYSIDKLDLPKGSKFIELAHDLSQVLSPDSYETAKKRYNRLVAPLKSQEKLGIALRQLTSDDLPAIVSLHDKWVEHKLSLPDTFRMMFPSSRYINCVKIALQSPDYLVYGAFQGETLLAVRCLYVDALWAFDLANFCNLWSGPSQLANNFGFWTMRAMWEEGIRHLNLGSAAGMKGLEMFKSHYPGYEVESWKYSQLSDKDMTKVRAGLERSIRVYLQLKQLGRDDLVGTISDKTDKSSELVDAILQGRRVELKYCTDATYVHNLNRCLGYDCLALYRNHIVLDLNKVPDARLS